MTTRYTPCDDCSLCIVEAISTENDLVTGKPWNAATSCSIDPMPEWIGKECTSKQILPEE
jgi:hypothetical protein